MLFLGQLYRLCHSTNEIKPKFMFKKTFIALRDLPRVREITAIFVSYGLGEFIQRLKLTKFLSLKPTEPLTKPTNTNYISTPKRFRLAFEELGPTFIKLGQILSTRVDIFPPNWIEEFEHLQNNVKPVPAEEIKELIAKLPAAIFATFADKVIGSASIAQVHRATLTNGDCVAVKVKRPKIEHKVQADLRILTHLVALIESELPETRRYQPKQMFNYFKKSLEKELDLSIELRYLQRFSVVFHENPNIRIPKAYPEYSSKDVLVQEFIEGTLIKNIDQLNLTKKQRSVVAQNIANTMLTMILEYGFFHADPHPGNIFLDTNEVITFIDFGLVGHLSQSRRNEILGLINALIERDAFMMQSILSKWAQGELPNEEYLGGDVLNMMLNYEHTPLKDLNINLVVNDITSLIREHALTLPADLVMLFKTLITLESVVKNLDGNFQLLEHTKPLVLKILKKRTSARALLKKSKQQGVVISQILNDLPSNLLHLSNRLRGGRLNINLDLKRLEQFGHQIDNSSNRLTMGIVTGSLIIGSSIVLTVEAGPKILGLSLFGLFGYVIAFLNSIWLLWSIWRSGKR